MAGGARPPCEVSPWDASPSADADGETEVIEALLAAVPGAETRYARLGLWAANRTDLFDLPSLRMLKKPAARASNSAAASDLAEPAA